MNKRGKIELALTRLNWHRFIRAYRLWKWRGRTFITVLIASEIAWVLYLQFIWVTLPELEMLAIIAACIAVENYFVNVKLMEQGAIEASPIWNRIERWFGFKYSYPLVVSFICVALWAFSSSQLGLPFAMLTVTFSAALPAAIMASINDAAVLFDGPILEQSGTQ